MISKYQKNGYCEMRGFNKTGLKRVDETCRKTNWEKFAVKMQKAPAFLLRLEMWQGWRDSNPQHADLESAALPIGATPL
uniref:Uncharacterized protein n=1 Tax=uncultured Vibrionales bacterium HF0010_22E23 TaxID=710999 RepID=E0XRJ4_9GAMM|nr:hypothetical protein [uncultured Vibrionales bacterium HF0010_22E23]